MYLTFDNPQFLWYLLSLPLLIISHFAFIKYNKRKALKFANFQALKRVTDQKVFTKNHSILFIRMMVLFFLILAISGTTMWYEGFTNENDFIIALDTSSSMTAQDISPTRIDAAKEYSIDFMNNLRSESRVGVVTFSGVSFIELLPTTDRLKTKNAISDIEITQVGGTNIPDAIVTSTNLLLDSDKGRTIILLTDGSNTVSYFNKDPVGQGIQYAIQNNVIIYTIGIGSISGPIGYLPEYYNISAVYDEQTLLRIANETNGKFYNAMNADELKKSFDDILINAQEANLHIDLAPGLMIMALGLIFLEWGLISTRFRAIP